MAVSVAPQPAVASNDGGLDGVSRRTQQGVKVFARIKHTVCALYLGAQTFASLASSTFDITASHAYSPRLTAVTYAVLSTLHVFFLVATCRRRQPSAPRPVVKASLMESFPVIPSKLWARRPWTSPPPLLRWVMAHVPDDAVLAVFNTVELACQSIQAFEIAANVVNPVFVGLYIGVVVLHCVVSPWFFLHQHSVSKLVLLSCANSVFSFGTSCLLPFLGLVLPILRYLVIDSTLSSDPTWYTGVILFTRTAIVTSPSAYVVKVTMDLGTLFSLRRLLGVLRNRTPTKSGASFASTPSFRPQSASLHMRVYISISLAWGVCLTALCLRTMLFRPGCPSTCRLETTPLLDMSCQCRYVHIDCHALGSEGLDVDALLAPAVIGTTVFALKVNRCDVPRGIAPDVLAHQQDVYSIYIEFTNMTEWRGVLPPTTYAVVLRYGKLASIPDILLHPMPPIMTTLRIEGMPLQSLPPDVDLYWQSLSILKLIDTNVASIPPFTANLGKLQRLILYSNHVAEVPQSWQTRMGENTRLTVLNLAFNDVVDVPLDLRADVRVDLTGNPIDALPPSFDMEKLTPSKLFLSHTTYCNATNAPFCGTSACARGCLLAMLGDHDCDLACFNAACQFDRGDCAFLEALPT